MFINIIYVILLFFSTFLSFFFFKQKTAYEMRISDWSSDVCSSDLPEPMTLKSQLIEDMKSAMKSGEKTRLGVIRLINAAIKQREVDERIELDDRSEERRGGKE